MAYRKHKRRLMGEINVVPYIDVMLVLLVIFMVTAPLLSQGVKVELPQASSDPVKQEAGSAVVVTVDAQGQYFLEHGIRPAESFDPQALALRVAAIRSLDAKAPVYVKGDRDVSYGKVVAVMAMLQQVGVDNVGLLTEAPPTEVAGGTP